MYFIVLILIGTVIPFLLMKIKSRWVNWSPAIILLFASIIFGIKAAVFPGEGMRDLADTLYFLLLGAAGIGAIIGGVIVHFFKRKR
ncbi:hypothetical protein [Neobacillus drentensis]|uniref:hypothetical protein n=1 Tax=Neobacillus drentensis TaxID=220684 RepID=UPI0030005DF1